MRRVVRRAVLAVVVAAAVVGVLTPLVLGGALSGLAAQLNDLQFPSGSVDDRLTVVELPLAATDWTRAEHAELVAALAEDGPAAIAYDVVMDAARDGDDELAAAIASAGNVVLAADAQLSGDVEDGLLQAVTVTRPTPELAAAAVGVGNVNVVVSRVDTTVRRVPLVVEGADRRLVPSLSLATVMVAEGLDLGAVTLQEGSGVVVGDEVVPTDPQRALEVTWSLPPGTTVVGERRDQTSRVDAATVLAGGVSLADRIVLVGVVDPLADVVGTPVDATTTPEVYVHANAVNTMLADLYRSGPEPGTTLGVVAVLAAAVALVGMLLRLSLVPVLALTLLVGWQAVVNVRFQQGVNVDNLWPNVAVLLAAGGVLGARHLTEERERRRVAGLFRQHVPDEAVDGLLATDVLAAAAEGQRREVTVLICALRGFTATATHLAPTDVRATLAVYYDVATRILHEHGGTVLLFADDEVVAVFGAPLDQPDHAERALAAAVALQDAGPTMNARLDDRGVTLAYGIGLDTGEVVAAHVDSRVHGQYTVVGETVDVGARLCSLAEPGGIVLSRATRDALDRVPPFELLRDATVTGVTEDPEPARLR